MCPWTSPLCAKRYIPTIFTPIRELQNAVKRAVLLSVCCFEGVCATGVQRSVFVPLSNSAWRLIPFLPECMFCRAEWLITAIWSLMWSILTSTLTKSADSSPVLLRCAAFSSCPDSLSFSPRRSATPRKGDLTEQEDNRTRRCCLSEKCSENGPLPFFVCACGGGGA